MGGESPETAPVATDYRENHLKTPVVTENYH